MPIIVELPDGKELEFPDGMPTEQIDLIVKRDHGNQFVQEKSGMIAGTLSRKAGEAVATAGLVVPTLADKGAALIQNNQAEYGKFKDIQEKGVLGFLGEAGVEAVGDVSTQAIVGGIGTAIGAVAAPFTGGLINPVSGNIAARGIYNFANAFREIREDQAKDGIDDLTDAVIGAAASAGLEYLGPVSKLGGKLGRSVLRKGRKEVLEELAKGSPKTLKDLGFKLGKGGLSEFTQEVVQESIESSAGAGKLGIPDVAGRFLSEKSLFAGTKGAVGGVAATGAQEAVGLRTKSQQEAEQRRAVAAAKAQKAREEAAVAPAPETVPETVETADQRSMREKREAQQEEFKRQREEVDVMKLHLEKERLAVESIKIKREAAELGIDISKEVYPLSEKGINETETRLDRAAAEQGLLSIEETKKENRKDKKASAKIEKSIKTELIAERDTIKQAEAQKIAGAKAIKEQKIREKEAAEADANYFQMKREATERKVAAKQSSVTTTPTKTSPVEPTPDFTEDEIYGQDSTTNEGYEDVIADAEKKSRFSGTTNTPSKPLSKQETERLAKEYVKDWVTKPEIVVFDNFYTDTRIPADTKAEAQKRKISNPAAFKVGSTIYLNSNKIGSTADVAREMSHEGVGHIAVELYHNGELDSIYDNVYNERQEDAQKYTNYDHTNEQDRRIVASEIVAKIAQEDPKNSIVRKVIVAVRNYLRKKGVHLKLRDIDIIENYILPAANYMKKGEVKGKPGLGTKPTTLLQEDVLEGGFFKKDKYSQDQATDATQELSRRHRLETMKREGSTSFQTKRPGLKSLYKMLNNIENELKDPHLDKYDIKRLDQLKQDIENDIYDETLDRMREMVKKKTKFQHDFKDYKKLGKDQLKNLYVQAITVGDEDARTEIGKELAARGLDVNRLPRFPDVDDLGEVLPPDTTLGELEAEKFSQQIQEAQAEAKTQQDIDNDENIQALRRRLKGRQITAVDTDGKTVEGKLKPEYRGTPSNTRFQHWEDSTAPSTMMGKAVDRTTKPFHDFVKSVTDTLRERGGIVADLGNAIQNLVDLEQANRGKTQHFMESVIQKLTKSKSEDAEMILEQFKEIADAAAHSKPEAKALLADADPLTQELMQSIRDSLDTVGKKMESLGMMATDPKTGKKVPFKMRSDFIPSILIPRYRVAITNPKPDGKSYTKDFQEIADLLISEKYQWNGKPITSHDEANAFFQDTLKEGNFESGFFGDMGMNRKLPLPPEAYDHSLDAMRKYLDRAAERLAQVEAFTTTNKEGKKVDLFDLVLEEGKDAPLPSGDPLRGYINRVKDQVYQDRFVHGWFPHAIQTLNTFAAGTQLSGQMTVLKNFFGGLTNVIFAADLKVLAKAMSDITDPDIRAAVHDIANKGGITSDNTFRLMSDQDHLGLSRHQGLNKAMKGVSKLTANLMSLNKYGPLSHISFNTSENAVREVSTLIGIHQLNSWMEARNLDPFSSRSKVFEKFVKEEGIDIESLMKEPGYQDIDNSPQTARFLRRFVNRTQGSYRLDQVPRWLDTPYGRFLFKYNKYGFQLGRQFDKHVIELIKDPDTAVQGWINFAKFAGVYSSMGFLTAKITEAIFGTADLPDEEEIKKTLGNKPAYGDKAAYVLKLWANSMHILGAFGPISLARSMYDQYNDYGTNPISAPGLSVLENTSKVVGQMFHSETGVTGEEALKNTAEFLINTFAPIRQGEQAFHRGYEYAAGIKASPYVRAKRVMTKSRKARDRFLSDTKKLDKTTPGRNWMPIIPQLLTKDEGGEVSTKRVLNDSIHDALLIGDIDKAKKYYKRAYDMMPNEREQASLQQSVSMSIVSRRPMVVYADPGGMVATNYFDEWAKKHLPDEDYKEIKEFDQDYMKAADKAFPFIKKKSYSEPTIRKAVKDYERSIRPIKRKE